MNFFKNGGGTKEQENNQTDEPLFQQVLETNIQKFERRASDSMVLRASTLND